MTMTMAEATLLRRRTAATSASRLRLVHPAGERRPLVEDGLVGQLDDGPAAVAGADADQPGPPELVHDLVDLVPDGPALATRARIRAAGSRCLGSGGPAGPGKYGASAGSPTPSKGTRRSPSSRPVPVRTRPTSTFRATACSASVRPCS